MQKILTVGLVAAGLCLAAAPASAGPFEMISGLIAKIFPPAPYPKIVNGPPS